MVGQGDQALGVEPGDGHGLFGLAALGFAPAALAAEGETPGSPFRYPKTSQEVHLRSGTLALLEAETAQLAPDPGLEAAQLGLAAGVTEVGDPSQGDAPVAPGDLPNPLLQAGRALRGDPQGAIRQEPIAEELARPDRGHGALVPVDLEMQPAA